MATPIPVGWRLVPEVPTEEQMSAGLYQASHDADYADVCQSYMDMVKVAPEPPAVSPDAINALVEALGRVKVELAALIPNPTYGPRHEWPVANPGDADCLQKAWDVINDALTDAAGRSAFEQEDA